MEGAGGGEAVAAAQVAVVRDQQAHGLDDAGVRVRGRLVQVLVVGKEGAALLKGADLADPLADLLLREAAGQRAHDLLRRALLPAGDDLVSQLVEHVDRAGVHVQGQIAPIHAKGMYHEIHSP